MKSLLLFTFISASFYLNAQSSKTEKALQEIGEYKIDDSGYVTFERIVTADSMTKDQIFNKAQEYFTYNYGDGESVIQINDRESGRVIGKGLYKATVNFTSVANYLVDTWHILRIDAKDGKARLTISLVQYDMKLTGMNGDVNRYTDAVSEEYPLNEKGTLKNVYGQAFAESYKRAMNSMDNLEKSLKGASKEW